MLKKAVQQGRSNRAGRMLRYVEPLSEARTMLADIFNNLQRDSNEAESATQCHTLVSRGNCAIVRRTVMNNAG